jgi:hypothetical protein
MLNNDELVSFLLICVCEELQSGEIDDRIFCDEKTRDCGKDDGWFDEKTYGFEEEINGCDGEGDDCLDDAG